jgi:hypothetical protein
MNLKDILHELAGRVNASHLHDEIDALPDAPGTDKPKSTKGDTA